MVFAFGDYELDTRRRELRRRGKQVALEPQVFDVLAFLVEHRDHVVSKQELFENVWRDRFVSDAALSSRVKAARKAVGDSGRAQRVIRTIHGRGLRFVAAVEERAEGVAPARAGPVAEPLPPLEPLPPADVFAVGRSEEFASLESSLQRALRGARQIIFITGESGLGKTTLVRAFLRRVQQTAGLRIGWGQCIQQRGAGEAYLPVLEAFGRLCREPRGGEVVELLARQAPAWLVQMPWLVAPEQREALQRRALGATRERMLREMVEAIEALTASAPLVLVLEDLHWSDYSTLDLLSLLARRPEPARLMLLGTYRPADAMRSEHPLHPVVQEMRIRGLCEELPLAYLSDSAIGELLTARFPGADFPESLPALLRQRTEGNPLFLDAVAGSWVLRGLLTKSDDAWRVEAKLEDLTAGVPETLRQLIEQQLAQLDSASLEVLEAASVAGVEFAAAAAAAGAGLEMESAESLCVALARQGRFLRMRGSAEWPDGTTSARFGFTHEVYREVFYERIPAGRRARLHLRIGKRLEAAYGKRESSVAVELASHFISARDASRAVRYLQLAAQVALRRSAHREAIHHLDGALELLPELPDASERMRQELNIQILLGPALIATRGWGAPEIEHAFGRARDLAQQLGEARLLSPVYCGLATLYEYRGEHRKAQQVIEQRLARPSGELLLESHELMACSQFHQGSFARALEHSELGLQLYDHQQQYALTALFGENPGVSCHGWAALAHWFLGYPERALVRARQALVLAQDHLYSLAHAQAQLAILHQLRREPGLAGKWAAESVALATEQGFPYRIATGTILHGWSLAAQGQPSEGITKIRAGLEGHRATGAHMDRPYFLALLAEACGWDGRPADGLKAIEEALALLSTSRSFFYEAELHRLRGELLLQTGPDRTAEAGACLEKALAIARRQQARSLELRAALSLSRHWLANDRSREARAIIEPVVAAFTEGVDSADMHDARRVLETASQQSAAGTRRRLGKQFSK